MRVLTLTCLCISILLLNSCTVLARLNNPKICPLPESGVVVEGNGIYHGDKLFAELVYFVSNKEYNSHRGVAIYYYPCKKAVWIFPDENEDWRSRIQLESKEGFTIQDLEKLSIIEYGTSDIFFLKDTNSYSEGGLKLKFCFDVRISEDGKYVIYKTPGLFFNSSHKYLVEYGLSR